jgi:hypothetical protein
LNPSEAVPWMGKLDIDLGSVELETLNRLPRGVTANPFWRASLTVPVDCGKIAFSYQA